MLEDCRRKIEELDRILGQILPVPGKDGVWTGTGKALASMTKERRIAVISEALDKHLQVLALQQATHAVWLGFRSTGKIVCMTILTTVRIERKEVMKLQVLA